MSPGPVDAWFPASAGSAARARDFVQRTLAGWHCEAGVVDQARLLTSELVSNAIRHAGTDSRVRVEHRGDVLRVEVEDAGCGRAVLRAPSAGELAGRGLRIVDAVAQQWGDDAPTTRRYVVWFELPACSAPGPLEEGRPNGTR